ncbi:MAG TPA: flagellar basal body P-ring protein FlgI [Candidatus Angelobacter sp.]|nr:flagellar basal body P-ring protein FlgI [Candidatus Angelobacter sp.]
MLTAQKTLRRRRTAVAALIAALMLSGLAPPAGAADGTVPTIAAGSEQDVLVGVGVVIGLPGTGDSAIDANALDASIVGVLKRAGLEPWHDQIKPGRVAVVMLSAELPDGARDGTRIAVSISAIGDARSIAGGTLLVAPLRDANGAVHAIGQGLIAGSHVPSAAVVVAASTAGVRTAELAQGAVIKHQAADRTYAALAP